MSPAPGGDAEERLRAMLDAHGRELRAFLYAVLRDDVAVDEVWADVCEDLWRGLPSFRNEASPRTWAYVIARRACSRFRTRSPRRRETTLSEAGISQLTAPRPSTHLRREARHEALARIRDELSEEDRALLVLRIDRSLSWDEVTRAMSDDDGRGAISAAAVRKRFERIKEQIRERLDERARENGS